MDRQMLRWAVVAAIALAGCSSEDSTELTASVDGSPDRVATFSNVGSKLETESKQYQARTTYDFADDVVDGEMLRPESKTAPPEPPAIPPAPHLPTGPSGHFPTVEPPPAAYAPEMTAAERAKLAAMLEAQNAGTMGVLGGSSFAEPRAQNAPPTEISPGTGNPLRSELTDLPQSSSAGPNPLREPRIATGLGGPPPSFAPAPPVPPSASSNPSGGAAPPPGGLDEIIRAFTENASSPGSGGTSLPGAAEPAGPAAPEPTFGSAAPEDAMGDSMLAGASPVITDNRFDAVEVFYGTDRQSTEAPIADWGQIALQFAPAATVALMALCLGLAAAGRKSWVLWSGATVGIVVGLGLGYWASAQALAMVRSAGKPGPRYTTQRSPTGQIEVGMCEITIPKSHERGELESPSIFRLEILEDAAEHVILSKTERLADAEFFDRLKERVGQSERRELFVFVHGFNVSFEDAARRTAQIHHDLKFDGAPIFFSWPANDKFILTYPADETNVAWSVPHLKQFLLSIVNESGARSINLIAHSMGNRALAAALREIDLEMREKSRLFNQVILAAPDIDADDFRNNIAPAMQRTAQRLTLYASSHDEALLASHILHRAARAGDAGDGLIVMNGIDTIDVTAIDRSLWGHAYYGSSHPVLHDLRTLLSRAVPPSDRTWLSPAQRDGLTYWIFQPLRTAGADGGVAR